MQQPNIKNKNNSGWLWLVPILALGVGLWLAYARLSSAGPEISVVFKSAEGIKAGSTKLRYKDLDVGTVSDVELSDDLMHVVVKAKMLKTAVPLLKTDTQFWVVKPQISASGITGLNTIISGSYIAIEPGNKPQKATDFIGLEDIPLTTPSEPGLRIQLVTNDATGINVGTPLYYRGIKVGQVEQIKFDKNFNYLDLSVFVRAPYDQLVTSNTRFYNIGGFSFQANTDGIDLSLESAETLFLGGISFTTPTTLLTSARKVDDNTVFTLYKSQQDSQLPSSFAREYYVVYFDDSPRGLKNGSKVVLNGMDVGQVVDVRLLYDAQLNKTVVPILIEIEPGLIEVFNSQANNPKQLIMEMVQHGLHASLETANYLTGQKMITLKFYDNQGKFTKDPYSSYQVLPTKNTGLSKITDDVANIVNTIKKLPIKQFFNKAVDAAGSASDSIDALKRIVEKPELQNLGVSLQESIKKLNDTLGSIKNFSDTSSNAVGDLNAQINELTKQLEHTLYGLSPESTLYYNIQQTLQELQQTAKSVNQTTKIINEKPNALIFGGE